MSMTTSVHTVRINLKNTHIVEQRIFEDEVAVEIPINILINDKHCITLLASPNASKELGIGYILSEGIIKSFDECLDVDISENAIKITTKSDCDFRRHRILKLVTTACVSTKDYIRLLDRMDNLYVSSDINVSPNKIIEIIRNLNKQCEIFRKTGGTHAAGLFDPSTAKALCIFEDVGRHNAIDKVIGFAVLNGLNFSELVLASTGRMTADMVLKAARMSIPVIASIAGPINSGIIFAEKTGITLVCFVRGKRINVYSHKERID
ncbi:MAG: formate dehydrogenase accessory sulfurtransferase FdhD [Promethearchaeota archaeon]